MEKTPNKQRDGEGGLPGFSTPGRAHAASWIRNMLVGSAAQILAAPIIGMCAGFLLLFGGIFLAVAWQVGPQPLIDSAHYAKFTGNASGRIIESWVALDFDPDNVRKSAVYWQPSARISACAVIEYGGDWGAPLRRAFCGNRFSFREDFRLDDWDALAPGIPFAFSREPSGFALEEIRLSKIAMGWLKSHPPSSTFMLSKPPPTTALGALKEQFDRPVDVAAASWSAPVPPFPLAFDPKLPGQAMPAKYVGDRREPWLGGLVFAVILCIPGLLVWRVGMTFLFGGQSRSVFWLATLVPLLALPWWSDALPALLKHVNKDWASIGSDMLDDINRTTLLIASDPADALLADGERIVWRVGEGAYADTFGRMHFSLPTPAPTTPKAALATLEEQVTAQVRTLDSATQAALFTRLRSQKEAGLDNVQNLFAPAAEHVLRDANADAAAHRAARGFLMFAAGHSYYEDQLDAMEVQPQAR
jgi:hypothetical protein